MQIDIFAIARVAEVAKVGDLCLAYSASANIAVESRKSLVSSIASLEGWLEASCFCLFGQ